MIRRLRGLDKMFYDGRIMTPLVLRFKDSRVIAPIAENLAKNILAFQLGTDGHILYKNERNVPIYDLPNISDNEELCHYMVRVHTEPYNYTLGTIGVSSDTIVINCNKMAADSGYLRFIVDEISNGRNTGLDGDIPYPMEYLFEKEIIQAPYLKHNIKNMTDFISQDTDQLNCNPYSQMIIKKFPASSITSYNKEKKTIECLTEKILSNFYAATVAYNSQSYKCGFESWCDLRKYLKKQSWNNTCTFSIIPVISHVTPDDTMGELAEKLGNSIKIQEDCGGVFSFLKNIHDMKNNFRRAQCEVSNIGKTYLHGPLVDAYYGYSELSKTMKQKISITTFNVIGEDKDDITFHMKYNCEKVSEREARMMSESTIWALQNIESSMTLERAIDELKDFQKQFLKQNKGTVLEYFEDPNEIIFNS